MYCVMNKIFPPPPPPTLTFVVLMAMPLFENIMLYIYLVYFLLTVVWICYWSSILHYKRRMAYNLEQTTCECNEQ